MKKIEIVLLIILLASTNLKSQQDTFKYLPKEYFFANIYTKFYATKYQTGSKLGFFVHTGLFGYSKALSNRVKGTIVFDVTRTTNNIIVKDSNNNQLNVSFFEGSKYTAYLKMAEIEWQFAKNFYFKTGQLLNTQYLTFIDKFWQHRYVEVTFQELYRFGNPADFGSQLTYSKKDKLTFDLGIFNGEGPFRYQDFNSDFLVSSNFIFYPIQKFVVKVYLAEHFTNIDSLNNKYFMSFFAGFSSSKFTFGAEYCLVKNADFVSEKWSGASFFAFYNISNIWQILYRFDYVQKSALYRYNALHIAGFQYKPADNFFISLNLQHNRHLNERSVFFACGLKF